MFNILLIMRKSEYEKKILLFIFVLICFINLSCKKPFMQTEVCKNAIEYDLLTEIPFWASQGCCYIENGIYLIAYPSSTGDLCIFKGFDSIKKQYIFEKFVYGCGHVNSICFRPIDRKLYIAECTDNTGDIVNRISVIDFDNIESGVINVLFSPARGSIYSIAYDVDSDKFYSTNYIGVEEGDANVLFSYNGIFESVNKEIVLDDFSVRYKPHHSSQGVQCVVNDIAYIPYYEPTKIIAGYSIDTGELLLAYTIPDCIGTWYIGELETVFFDPIKESLIISDSFTLIEISDLVINTKIQKENLELAKCIIFDYIPYRWALTGCYIEDEKYIICYVSSDGSNLIVRCYDSKECCFLWTKIIPEIDYANSICFRKKDRKLYIAETFKYANQNEINDRIQVLEYDNIEKGIVSTIEPNARGGIYSIAYDIENDIFYSTNYLDEKSNIIFKYNGIFSSVDDEIELDYQYSELPYSTMGVQCVVNDIIFELYHTPEEMEPNMFVGFQSKTGRELFMHNIPSNSNANTPILRPEALLYNDEEKKIFLLTATGIFFIKNIL